MSKILHLKSLHPDQYRQVAEWEFGKQENVDWDRYTAEMSAPQWQHLGIYAGPAFVGALSLERIDRQTMAYHVVTDRHKVRSAALADILLSTAGRLFNVGFTSLVVRIPRDKRAAAILALRCGMLEDAGTDKERHFTLTRQRYGQFKT